jgi:hypothetical protein
MNRYTELTVDLLQQARTAHEYLPIRVHEIAHKYGIETRYVQEKLVELHANKFIKLSAWDENESREKVFDEWQSPEFFFAYASDGFYKRIRLLLRGAEFLENLEASAAGSNSDRDFASPAIDGDRKSAPELGGNRQRTPSEEVEWENFTPGALIEAVKHVRERFEEEEFKFDFATQQQCYKELHPVAPTQIAPAVFKHYMDVFQEGLKQAIKNGFDDLFEIGLANANLLGEGLVEWAKSHLVLLIAGKEYKIKQWIKSVCDQQEMAKSTTPEDVEEFIHWRTWRAPILIIMQPSGNRPYDAATVWARATKEETEKFLDGLSKRFVQSLGFHLDRLAGEAHVRLAKQGQQIQRPSAQERSAKGVPGDKADVNTPIAFVSYSWDSDAHKQWVLNLAVRLQVQGGVRIILDRWHLPPGEDKTAFVEKSVGDSKFVILICTPDYARRANNREGGVGYETMIITSELAEDINQRKFIPVLRDGDWKSSLPVWIKNKFGVDLRSNPYSDEQYKTLLRALHNEPFMPPAIGPKPVFKGP